MKKLAVYGLALLIGVGLISILAIAKDAGWDEWKACPGGMYQTNITARLQRVVYDDGWEVTMKWSKNWISQGNPADDPNAWVGAWTTNHWKSPNGEVWFYKIVYTGPDSPLWGYFTTIQMIGAGVGSYYKFDSPMGFGYYKTQWSGY